MFVEFFSLKQDDSGETSPPVQLLSVYHLCADHTYRVDHPGYTGGRQALVFTRAGKGVVRLGNTAVQLGEGDCLLMRPEKFFFYRCSEDHWEFWWFEFVSPSYPGIRSVDPGPTGWRLWNVGSAAPLLDLFAESLTRLKQGETAVASALFSAAYALLETGTAGKDGDAVRFQHAVRHIHIHLDTVTVSSLAGELYMSERTLRSLFLRQAGCSPSRYIQEVRLETARHLLRNTTKTVAEIALALGYSSQFHFSKAFRQRQGLSPLQYRRQQRESTEIRLS